MLKGNRGEWSEVYAFLRILADGEIEPADANLNVLKDEPAIPVVRIIREEKTLRASATMLGIWFRLNLIMVKISLRLKV